MGGKVNVEQKQHGYDIGAMASGTVAGVTTAAVTFAGTTDIADRMSAPNVNLWQAVQQSAVDNFGKAWEGVKTAGDFVTSNIGKVQGAAKQAQEAVQNISTEDLTNAVGDTSQKVEAAKQGWDSIKGKAGEAFEAVKDVARDVWNKFEDIKDPKIKAGIVTAAVVIPILATAIATNAAKPETEVAVTAHEAKVESKSTAARSKTTELTF